MRNVPALLKNDRIEWFNLWFCRDVSPSHGWLHSVRWGKLPRQTILLQAQLDLQQSSNSAPTSQPSSNRLAYYLHSPRVLGRPKMNITFIPVIFADESFECPLTTRKQTAESTPRNAARGRHLQLRSVFLQCCGSEGNKTIHTLKKNASLPISLFSSDNLNKESR